MTNIAIAGVTATGNMGGVAMLRATVQEMSRRIPEANFVLLSVAAQKDRQHAGDAGITIVPAPPLLLVGIYLPLSVLLWPFWRRGWLRWIVAWIPYFRALQNCDLLIDLSGIAFVDDRGIALLMYNLAVFVPALALGVPVAKLSQALGPFDRWLNRTLARRSLRHCVVLVARGNTSFAALQTLGAAHAVMLPDVTFCLEVPDRVRAGARNKLAELGVAGGAVIVSPSEVVRRYLARRGRDFADDLTTLIGQIRALGMDVVLLPHSFGAEGSKNNDVPLCRQIYAALDDHAGVWLIDDVQDPVQLRALIGEARVFIGSRFHSVVAALALGVPALTIGWSHKYLEMAALLSVEDLVLDYSAFSPDAVMERLAGLLADEDTVTQRLQMRLQWVRAESSSNFDLAAAALGDTRC